MREGVASVVKWNGPALGALGLLLVVLIAIVANKSLFAGWFLLHVLAPERLVPLIGFGAACGVVGVRTCAIALMLIGVGITTGFAIQDAIVSLLYTVLHGPAYLFLTGPISCLAVGLALVSGTGVLPWLLPLAAFIEGVMLAIAIFLTNPTLDDPIYTWVPLLTAIWIIAAVSQTVRAFQCTWFALFGRILGSWILAIGFLYGGALLVPLFKPPQPPLNTSRESPRGAEVNGSIQGQRGTPKPGEMEPSFIPGGIEPKQP